MSFLLVAAGVVWIAAEWGAFSTSSARKIIRPIPGVPYAIECSWDGATFDLAFQPGSQYIVIVSSLGDFDRSYTVTLDASPCVAVTQFAARYVAPLRPRRDDDKHSIDENHSTAGLWALSGSVLQLDRNRESEPAGGAKFQPAGVERTGLKRTGERSFFLHVTDGDLEDPQQYVRISGQVVAEGKLVRVYCDRQQSTDKLAPGLLEEIVQLFDEEVIPQSRRIIGASRDVDGDGKFSILLSPWLGRLQGGRTSVGGFVRGTDFRLDVDLPFSNRCDMLYLNSNVQPGRHLRTLLAHEFTHAVCFSERLPHTGGRSGLPNEEDWLNEAIAHVAENLHESGWSNLDYRVSRFLNEPSRAPLVVDDYYRAGLWRDHGCRGATYLFLRWCVDQFDHRLLRRLIHGPARGTRNLEWATGIAFEDLYRRWSIALLQSGMQSGQSSPRRRGSQEEIARLGTPVSEAAECRAGGEYTSLDLRSRLGKRGLAGPRLVPWDVDTRQKKIHLRGTATAFIDVHASGSRGARRIRIHAEAGAQPQISVIMQPRAWPRIQIAVNWVSPATGVVNGPSPSQTKLAVEVLNTHSVDGGLRIEMIAGDRRRGQTKKSFCFRDEALKAHQVSAEENNGGPIRGPTFLLPVSLAQDSGDEWIVKVVASDAEGRRATAWATVEIPVHSPDALAAVDRDRLR